MRSQVGANYAAWLEDSPPLAPDATLWGVEDRPLPLRLGAADPFSFDAAFSPRAPRAAAIFLDSLPHNGTLYAADPAAADVDAAVEPIDTDSLPLRLDGGLAWYVPPPDAFTPSGEAGGAPLDTLQYHAEAVTLDSRDIATSVPSDGREVERAVTLDGRQRSLPGRVFLRLHARNDAPRASPRLLPWWRTSGRVRYSGLPPPT